MAIYKNLIKKKLRNSVFINKEKGITSWREKNANVENTDKKING